MLHNHPKVKSNLGSVWPIGPLLLCESYENESMSKNSYLLIARSFIILILLTNKKQITKYSETSSPAKSLFGQQLMQGVSKFILILNYH